MGWVAPSEMLMIHGLVLMVCGALAFQASGFQEKALSAIYVGNGGAVVSFLLAVGMRDTTLKKGQEGYKVMMASVHLAVVYPMLIGGAVAWRLSKAWDNPDKAYLKPYFGTIVGISALTAVAMIALKPKREKVKVGDAEREGETEKEGEPVAAAEGAAGVTKRKARKAAAM